MSRWRAEKVEGGTWTSNNEFWTVAVGNGFDFDVISWPDYHNEQTNRMYADGNYFKTRAEAKKMANIVKKLFAPKDIK